jgi:hypothetical protein
MIPGSRRHPGGLLPRSQVKSIGWVKVSVTPVVVQ